MVVGGWFLTLAGRKSVGIVGVDEEGLSVRHPLWNDRLARTDLGRAVELMGSG
jgi:hypothetical protein